VVGIDSKCADDRDLLALARTTRLFVPARATLHARARAEVAREIWSVNSLAKPFANKCEFSKRPCDALDGIKKPGLGRVSCLIKRHVFDNLFLSRHQLELIGVWLLKSDRLAKACQSGAYPFDKRYVFG
jgi:hypothetical protein